MSWWEALILGLVQGASEFLPISSSGHLLLLEKLGVGAESLLFNVTVHGGTLLAVLIVMRKGIWQLMRHPIQKKTGYLIAASLPTVALALTFKLLFPALLTGELLGFGFVLTACLLFAGEKLKCDKTAGLTVGNSILTGVMQGIAVLPGVSRSGATISALTFLGVDKRTATDFSFLLSIPVICGSLLLEGAECISAPPDVSPLCLAVGAVAAFLSGLAAMTLLTRVLTRRSLLPFAAYTLLLGVAVTLAPLFGASF